MSSKTQYYTDWRRTKKHGEQANRQMERMVSCKSHYIMHCYACNKPIKRGDLITQVASSNGMKLRWRGCGRIPETDYGPCFYTPFSGQNLWVHRNCIPCLYDEISGKYTPYWTEYSSYVYSLYDEHLNSYNKYSTTKYDEYDEYYISYEQWAKQNGLPKCTYMIDMLNKYSRRIQKVWKKYNAKKI